MVVESQTDIRRATPEDADEIAEVHVASIRGLASGHYSATQIAAWSSGKEPERYRKAMESGEKIWVARRHNHIVGFGSWHGDELRAIYVRPSNAREGVGSELLEAVENDARASGRRELQLEASLNAVAFYRSKGWTEVSRATRTLRSGTVLECAVMKKALV